MEWTETQPKGNGHKDALHFNQPPKRVVSLMPSMTESMFDLGLGGALVGITDYCIYPASEVEKLPRVGGPKNPRIDEILALKPDLVLANWEENTYSSVESMRNSGLAVWVTLPKTVEESMDVLWTLANLFRSHAARLRIQTLEVTLDWAISASEERKPFRYFCPIWYSHTQDSIPWWMTFNQDTYCDDLLRLLGGRNVFSERTYDRILDGETDPAVLPVSLDVGLRYPRVNIEDILSSAPELILLPSEPYEFKEEDLVQFKQLFKGTPAVDNGCLLQLDGTLIMWQGTRLAASLRELPALLDSCQSL
jgi:ABC-type Fe3+-hydroxamate transport system substrate-binding protein